MTLTDFLLARIAEDEGLARTIYDHDRWIVEEDGNGDEWVAEVDRADQHWRVAMLKRIGVAEHIALHDPARVLAECGVKRRIVARHRPFSHGLCQACHYLAGQDDWTACPWPCPDLRDLASVYADHPDYRDEWKP